MAASRSRHEDVVKLRLDPVAERIGTAGCRVEQRSNHATRVHLRRRLREVLEKVLHQVEPAGIALHHLPDIHHHLVQQDERRESVLGRLGEQLLHDICRRRRVALLRGFRGVQDAEPLLARDLPRED